MVRYLQSAATGGNMIGTGLDKIGTNEAAVIVVNKMALQITVICVLVLIIKVIVFNINIAVTKGKAAKIASEAGVGLSSINDGGNKTGAAQNPLVAEALAATERAKNIVQNDLENIPLGLVSMVLSALIGRDAVAHIILAIIFTVGRVAHSIVYANNL